MNPWARVALALALFAAGLATGWRVEAWRADASLSEFRAEAATQHAAESDQSLNDLKHAATVVHDAAIEAASTVEAARSKILATQARPYVAPLPVDCRPDLERLQRRNAAIAAYNAARAGSESSR